MISLNTTFHVEDEIHLDFLAYIKQTYIYNALLDEYVRSARLCKIHSHRKEEGHSYSVQFRFNNLDELEIWDKVEGKKHNEKLLLEFNNKIAGFSTLLEEIKL
ncbi:MAG: DUF4286 family protein [Dysgonamonadaceae bacterium]|nr:DUF4286 family protein [Dysgonamonadaceae bacterium]MDD4727509.1 DUF4286 family protein [Dysgonamonadaceae bacterium]